MIRLSRFGKRKKPTYRIVISEKARDPKARYLELLGNYNPHTEPSTVQVNTERVQYWISQGAQCSNTVHNLLINQGVIKGEKRRKGAIKKKGAETEAASEKPAETPAEAPKQATEAPAEEAVKPETAETKEEAPAEAEQKAE